jgi:hypothetical protein
LYRYLLSLLLPVALFAGSEVAFSNLAATSQGDLYLTSSLVLPGPRPANGGTAFHYAPGKGFEWFSPDWGPVRGGLDVSADGRVFAGTEVKTTLECVLSHCQWLVTATSRVVAPNFRRDSINGYAQVSRNGRYALLSADDSQTLLDFSTGTARFAKGSPTALRQAVADDGSLLLRGNTRREILLHREGGVTLAFPRPKITKVRPSRIQPM